MPEPYAPTRGAPQDGPPLHMRARHAATLAAWLAGRAAIYAVALGVALAVPATVGAVGGLLFGHTVLGVVAVMTVAAGCSYWWSRVVLATLWWVRTAQWDWRRTSLRRSLGAGWPR